MIKAVIFDFNGVIYLDDYDNGLLQFIDQLRKNYKVGILTNYGATGYDRYIAPIKGHFDDVVVSSHVGLAKPDPQIYKLAAKRLGAELGECLYIDDQEYRVEGARQAGMQAILYKGFEQLDKALSSVSDN